VEQGYLHTAEQKEVKCYKQRHVDLFYEWEAIARKDSKAIVCCRIILSLGLYRLVQVD
jgi:hypothetical protein